MKAFAIFVIAATIAVAQHATKQDWPHYGGEQSSWRYSALDQIKASNVNKLVPVWAFQTGEIDGGLQATPLVVDGVMYVISSKAKVFAIDAATGKELWNYNYHLPPGFNDEVLLPKPAQPAVLVAALQHSIAKS